MVVLNLGALVAAEREHRDAAGAIHRWQNLTAAATWKNLLHVRRTFPNADGVNVPAAAGTTVIATVFNIRGNNYRLITAINYADATVAILFFLTHAEYDTNRWKGKL